MYKTIAKVRETKYKVRLSEARQLRLLKSLPRKGKKVRELKVGLVVSGSSWLDG